MIIPMIYYLKDDEQLLIERFTERAVFNGPGRYISRAFERVTRRKAVVLEARDYIYIKNLLTGEIRVERGPLLYFLQAHESISKRSAAIPLQESEYIKVLDNNTGIVRVERGEATVYLEPHEETLTEEPQQGITIDEHHAVIVRDLTSGQRELIITPQVFIPSPTQTIDNLPQRIRLEDHDTIIIRDRDGHYILRSGQDENRSFFLDPFQEIVQLWWSSGIHKDKRSLPVTRIDIRPKFMWFEFEVRTQDNVELIIGITFFWQITDVEGMIKVTDDAPGDLCSHARSMIIQSVSRVTLEQFLEGFNNIVRQAVIEADDNFYSDRGMVVHAVEVRSVACKDPDTQRILQEIIQETTNRLNRLQQQESENEVRLKHLQGQIEAEEVRGNLLEIQRQHSRTEAIIDGEAESQKVQAFLDGLGDLTTEQKVAIFNTLRKEDMLAAISQGHARVYFTPNDVNLTIES